MNWTREQYQEFLQNKLSEKADSASMPFDILEVKGRCKNANNLTKRIISDLQEKGVHAWRQNNVRVPGRKFIGKLGLSDIIGFITIDGKAVFLAIEIKADGDRLSKDQIEFIQSLRSAGGIAFPCGSFREYQEKLRTESKRVQKK